jgi:3-phosphoglycerate kinase
MQKATIRDIDVKGKKVFVRVDYNVPLKAGVIKDDTRIKESLPTIKYLLEHDARVILASHLGRPKGKVNEDMSLRPIAAHLSKLLGKEVKMLPDCIGSEVEEAVMAMKPGDLVLLENLRFHDAEEKNDKEFSQKLAKLAEVYVDDAFGTAHRAHASTYGVAEFIPNARVSGFLIEKELKYLGPLLHNPERPYVAIVGGAKVGDKVAVLKNLLNNVNAILIGGGMCFTFLKIKGLGIGQSLFDAESQEAAREIMELSKQKNVTIELPDDVVITDEIKEGAAHSTVSVESIPDTKKGVDIGPKTIEKFKKHLLGAKTIFWNGPMGVFEVKEFAHGTLEIARILAETKATTCVGGGDSVSAITSLGFADKMSHISTGGGASLEFLEGKELPGIAILMDKVKQKA